MELKIIHIADGDGVIEFLTRSAVCKNGFTVLRKACKLKTFADIIFVCTVKYGCAHFPAECHCGIAEMHLKHLTDIHTGRYAEGVKNDIKRATVGQERHILLRKNAGNNALVTVTTGHLIADLNFSLLRDINTNNFVYAGAEFIAVCTGEHLNINNDAVFAVRNAHGGVSYLSCLFAEDCAKQSFLCGKLRFALGRYLADEDVTAVYLCANADNTVLIKILQSILAHIGNISCDFLGAELGIS